MALYRQTFRRHRLLFILPIFISIATAAWFAFGAPKTYRSTASVWVDNGPVAGSSLDTLAVDAAQASEGLFNNPYGPAAIEDLTLEEQLAAPSFDLAVANHSLLPQYLKSGVRNGFSPSVLLKHGTPSLAYQITDSLATGVTTSLSGPEVLHISYEGPTAAVARSVLSSVIAHLKTNSTIYGNDFAMTEQMYFEQAASSATSSVASAEQAAATYKREHPTVTAQSDPLYASLVSAVKKLRGALSTATAALASTKQGAAGLNAVIREIDPPSLPSAPLVSSMQLALSLLGGLVAGLLIAIIAVVLSTPPSRRWDDELSTAAWMRLRWDRRTFTAARRQRAQKVARRRKSADAPLLRRTA